MRTSPAIEQIEQVAALLNRVTSEYMFVGGCTLDLLITDPAAAPSRPTEDVDVVIQVISVADFYDLEDSLRSAGFVNDTTSPVICRWIIDSIPVDIMPASEDILGFSNRWYGDAFCRKVNVVLPRGTQANHISAPYFLATKIECFNNPERENSNDFWSSRDLGDIIAVVDGRFELLDDCSQSPFGVVDFLQKQFAAWLDNSFLKESIGAHLLPDMASQRRKPMILNRLREIVNLNTGA